MAMQLDYTKLKPSLIKRKGLEVRHTFKISEIERLASWLANDQGSLMVECKFDWPEDGHIYMLLAINGTLNVQCKRCLEAFNYEWHSESTLQLNADDTLNEDRSDEAYERVILSHHGTFNLIDVIVDEVILGLPERHLTECPDNFIAELIN